MVSMWILYFDLLFYIADIILLVYALVLLSKIFYPLWVSWVPISASVWKQSKKGWYVQFLVCTYLKVR
jgi:hypothetical protein